MYYGLTIGARSQGSFTTKLNGAAGKLNIWYRSKTALSVVVRDDSGHQVTTNAGNSSGTLSQSNQVTITISPPNQSLGHGDNQILIDFNSSSSINYNVKVTLISRDSNPINVDAWSFGENPPKMPAPPKNFKKIGSPGASKEAITIGSFASRLNWTDSAGNSQTDGSGTILHQLSYYSSPGPLRNEGDPLKPDICTPGQWLVSALSSEASAEEAPASNRVSSLLLVMQGTSMATPVATGVVALLLQKNPKLNPTEIRSILTQTTGQPWNFETGYGLIDLSKVQFSD